MIKVLLIIGFSYVVSGLSIQNYNNVAATIANNEFDYNTPTSVVWCQSESQNIDEFIDLYKGVVVTTLLMHVENVKFQKGHIYEQIVLYVEKVDELNNFLTLAYNVSVKPMRMILVITEFDDNIKIVEFTKTAWEYDIADIIIISINENNETFLYTILPYSDGRCGDYTPVRVSVNQQNLFNRKFRNFYNCPIRVRAFYMPPYVTLKKQNNTIDTLKGFDADIMKMILERLNATMILVADDVGSNSLNELVNTSISGGLSDLIKNNADVLIPGFIINEKRYSIAQTTYVFSDMPVIWCAPKQREIYAWAKVILPFWSRITPLIIVSFVSFVASIKLINRFGKFKNTQECKGLLLGTFASFLGQDFKFDSKYWLGNAVFMFWIWYCSIIRIAYQGDLINGLYKIILEPPIKTLNNALQSLDEIVGIPSILDLYRNTSVEERFKTVEYNELPLYFRKISNGARILQAINKIFVTKSTHKVQVLDEQVSNFMACFFVRPRWAGSREIHRIISRITEVGFQMKIYQVYLTEYLGNKGVLDKVDALDMATLSSCFYGLIALYIMCVFVFCLEIIWFKISNTNP